MKFIYEGGKAPSKKSHQRIVSVLACITALHKSTDILTITRAFEHCGLHPIDLMMALKNPKVNHDPTIKISPKKRKAISIDNKVLTDATLIEELENQKKEREQEIKIPNCMTSFKILIFHIGRRRGKWLLKEFLKLSNQGPFQI